MKIGNATETSELATLLIHADRQLNPAAAVVPGTSLEHFLERSSRPRHPEFYTRYRNPNTAQVEAVLVKLEGAETAMLTGSAMAVTPMRSFFRAPSR